MLRLFFVFACVWFVVDGHSYSLGQCPDNVVPMAEFEMNKMLGIWFVIKKTSTSSSCLYYNFTRADEPYEYLLEQVSQNYFLSPIDHEYHYTGRLTVPDPSVSAKMIVKFPLNFGSASFTVFMTDYQEYAALFTCQKIAFGNRHSVSILSRRRTLDKIYLDKIQQKLTGYNINPFDLSIISQKNCPLINDTVKYNINVDDDTFSAHSVAGVFRKAGEKIGDGIEYVAGGAKNLYNDATKDDSGEEAKSKIKKYARGGNPDAEWLP